MSQLRSSSARSPQARRATASFDASLRDPQTAPGPRGHPLWGTLDARDDTLRFYLEARRRYGDFVRFQAVNIFEWYFVGHPNDIEVAMQGSYQAYQKGPAWDRLRLLLGQGLLTGDGPLWRDQRRLMQPAFHRDHNPEFAAAMTEVIEAMLQRWQAYAGTGRPFDVAQEMMRLTLLNAGRTLFGVNLGERADSIGREMSLALEYINLRGFTWPAAKRMRRFHRARRDLNAAISRIIRLRREEQRAGQNGHDDLLGLMLSQGMSGQQLHHEVMTFILTGHETTAIALAWTWYLLSAHPDARRRLQDELDTTLNGNLPTLDDLPKLPYLRMVFQEALRLYPPVWGLSRQTTEEAAIHGYRLPPQSLLLIMPYVTHRHPEFWKNPEGFDPERFTSEAAANRPRYAYLPFGGGPRQCIGNHFAMIEAMLTIAIVSQRYRLDLVPGHPVEPAPWVTLRPRYGIRMTLHER